MFGIKTKKDKRIEELEEQLRPTKIIHVEFDALGTGVYEVTVINNGDYVVNKIKYLEDEK